MSIKHPDVEGRSRFGTGLGLITALLVVVILTSAIHVRFAMGDKPGPRTPLTVEAVDYHTQESYQRTVSYLGLVTAGRKADLGFEIPGTVAHLPWREGSPVQAGQVIARLDDAALQADRRVTQADLEQARSELELAALKAQRQKELRDSGAVSKQAFDETRLSAQALASRVEAVSARLHSIDIQIQKAELRAPYAGVIADRYVQEGAVVNPGSPAVRFLETAGREAHVGVAVTKASKLKVGENYRLKLREKSFASTLLSIRPDVDPVTRVTTAVFSVPPEIVAIDGEPVTLELEETVDATGGWLPISSLLEGSRGLWTVLRIESSDQGLYTLREAVEVIEVRGNKAYVRGTLPPGSQVVASGTHRISPGTRITVAEAGAG